jgi:transcriptional regulator with XRE-family HTH domain
MARLARGMTLASLAGDRVSVSLISRIERGLVRPSLTTLSFLAERLGTDVASLVGGASGEEVLALARAVFAATGDDPAAVVVATAGLASAEARLLRARALAAQGRDDEAFIELGMLEASAEAELLMAELAARRGARDEAQERYRRALGHLPSTAADLRAEALCGLAGMADAGGGRATARSLYQQAARELASAASPRQRIRALATRGEQLSVLGDATGAARCATAAAELAALARAVALRTQIMARLTELGAELVAGFATPLLREASDGIPHRSIRGS